MIFLSYYKGKDFILELVQILKGFNDSSAVEEFSLTAFLVIIPLVLQKTSKNSKVSEHKTHLKRRLELWRDGNILELVRECESIQKRLRAELRVNQTQSHKVFTKFMLEGNVNGALRWIASKSSCSGAPVELTESTVKLLEEKHPQPKTASNECLLSGPFQAPNLVRFDELDEESIYSSAKNLKGSGGPSGLNSEGIKRILCSKRFGKESRALCYEVARVARRLCTEQVKPESLTAFVSCRLIPLSKDSGDGVRPIGIGEVLKRVIGRAIM